MRPADLAWAGFPLIWRRGLADSTFVFDLFVGRPAIAFAHRADLGSELLPFAERARAINQIANGRAQWCGLEAIARHCYLQRRDPQHGWQVQMLSNEICLHNPDPTARSYRVHRPHRPPGMRLIDDAGQVQETDELAVGVAPAETALVRLSRMPASLAERGRVCSIFQARRDGGKHG